jgi:hypothetical protein
MRRILGLFLTPALLVPLACEQEAERPQEPGENEYRGRYVESVVHGQQVAEQVGFYSEGTPLTVDLQAVRTFVKAELKRLVSECVFDLTEERYGEPGKDGGYVLERKDGRVKVGYVQPAAIPVEVTLERLYEFEREARGRMAADLKRLAGE